jgi:DNA invertase Pin-like site-specific DNA recombinase
VDLFGQLSNLSHELSRVLKWAPELVKQADQLEAQQRPWRPVPRVTGQAQHRLEPGEVAALVQRYQAGESTRMLATAFGIHQRTAIEHLARHGVDRRSNARKLNDEQVAEAARLYRAGTTLNELERRYGVSSETVRWELARAGVRRRPRGRPPREG